MFFCQLAARRHNLRNKAIHKNRQSASVNYANIAQQGILPVGGKKPSKRKASTKQTTSAVRKIIDSADDVERSVPRLLQVLCIASSSLVGQPSAPTTVTVSVTNTGNTINFTAPSPQPPALIQTVAEFTQLSRHLRATMWGNRFV